MLIALFHNAAAATECPGIAKIIYPAPGSDFYTSDFHVYVEFNADWVRANTYQLDVYTYSRVVWSMNHLTDLECARCAGAALQSTCGTYDDCDQTIVTPPSDPKVKTFVVPREYYQRDGYNPTYDCNCTGEHVITYYIKVVKRTGYNSSEQTSTVCTLQIEFNAHAPELNAVVTWYEPQDTYSYEPTQTGIDVPVKADVNIIQPSSGQICMTLERYDGTNWNPIESPGCYDASIAGHLESPDTSPYSYNSTYHLSGGTYRYLVYWTNDGTYSGKQADISAKTFIVSEFQIPPPVCGLPVIDYPRDQEHYALGSVPFRVTILSDEDMSYYEYRFKFYLRSGITWIYKGDQIVDTTGTVTRTLGYPIDSEGFWQMAAVKCITGSSECTDVCNSVEFYVDPRIDVNYTWLQPCDSCTYEYNEGTNPAVPLQIYGEYNLSGGALCFAVGVYNNGWQYTVEPAKVTTPPLAGSFDINTTLTNVTGEGSYKIRFFYSSATDCSSTDYVLEERSFKVVKYIPPPEENGDLNRITSEMPWSTEDSILFPPGQGSNTKEKLTPKFFINLEYIWYIIGMIFSIPFFRISPAVGFGVLAVWNYAGYTGNPQTVTHVEMVILPFTLALFAVARYMYAHLFEEKGGGG